MKSGNGYKYFFSILHLQLVLRKKSLLVDDIFRISEATIDNVLSKLIKRILFRFLVQAWALLSGPNSAIKYQNIEKVLKILKIFPSVFC